MIYNYIKVSIRNLLKYRSSSLLNILGLGFGIACCALCYLHIRFELGYDQFHMILAFLAAVPAVWVVMSGWRISVTKWR
jgi:hypothetical protein